MKFCPNDKSLLIPVRKGDKTVLRCPKCGYEEDASNAQGRYQSKTVVENRNTVIVLADNVANLPKVKTRGCPKCGHDEAYFWVQQTRAADEPPTRFYKCTKCGHTWREYE
ncbi:transcription factor S [Pyrobaculum sp. 3827-6]|uniref:transcription factor S n=1 Tax=Pyrobaculum sp. 3827-6 TaxID=2983604 RepID=UPI0021DA3743|nr:transcription factor S [Pyrobaculum sp. 3827-6]MCU7787353.1 transcription factor S [Pyrobaculum sp. 3827-6]